MITAAPRSAKALAVASPIPALAPMMTTHCPSNDCPSNDMVSGFPSLSRTVVETDRLDKTLPVPASLVKWVGCASWTRPAPRRPHTGRRRNDAAQGRDPRRRVPPAQRIARAEGADDRGHRRRGGRRTADDLPLVADKGRRRRRRPDAPRAGGRPDPGHRIVHRGPGGVPGRQLRRPGNRGLRGRAQGDRRRRADRRARGPGAGGLHGRPAGRAPLPPGSAARRRGRARPRTPTWTCWWTWPTE